MSTRLLLAVDTGSPLVSVAVGPSGSGVTHHAVRSPRSSNRLLSQIDAVMDEAGVRPAELEGLVGLAGPGSFTGLRVGLATLYGLHQALALPALALPTLEVLAAAGPPTDGTRPTVAAVRATAGRWIVQRFAAGETPPRELSAATTCDEAALASLGPCRLVGFDLDATAAARTDGIEALEPGPLAPVALRLAATRPFDPTAAGLLSPLYMAPHPARR